MPTKITYPKPKCTTCGGKTDKYIVWNKTDKVCRYCYKCCGDGSAAKDMGIPFKSKKTLTKKKKKKSK